MPKLPPPPGDRPPSRPRNPDPIEEGLAALELVRGAGDALKEALASLRVRNAIHAYAEEILNLGTWTWDARDNKATLSDNMFRLLGLEPADAPPDIETILPFLHPDERQRLRRLTDALQREATPPPSDYRVIRKDGQERLFSNRVRWARGAGNAPTLIGLTEDVTESRKSEAERHRMFILLQKSEELSVSGSWDFDLVTRVFTWSEGMYRLFDLKNGTPVEPEIYLRYATPRGMPAAERIVGLIRAGDADFEESVEIEASGLVKTLKLKAVVAADPDQRAAHVLGVDMDITAILRAEARDRDLFAELRDLEERQRMELLTTTLNTQESERRRISESLHNGIGQVLYGIQLHLARLQLQPGQTWEQGHTEHHQAIQRLLTDAIDQARRVSHELTPGILEDFGLKAALEDICAPLQGVIEMQCVIENLPERIEQYIEIALYRTVQELVANILKHARATKASMILRCQENAFHLEVTDNGSGFEPGRKNTGIGLKTIRDRVALLKGDFRVETNRSGTTVRIRFPEGPA